MPSRGTKFNTTPFKILPKYSFAESIASIVELSLYLSTSNTFALKSFASLLPDIASMLPSVKCPAPPTKTISFPFATFLKEEDISLSIAFALPFIACINKSWVRITGHISSMDSFKSKISLMDCVATSRDFANGLIYPTFSPCIFMFKPSPMVTRLLPENSDVEHIYMGIISASSVYKRNCWLNTVSNLAVQILTYLNSYATYLLFFFHHMILVLAQQRS